MSADSYQQLPHPPISRSSDPEDITTEDDGASAISPLTQPSDGPDDEDNAELEGTTAEEGRADRRSLRSLPARDHQNHQNPNHPFQIERKPVPTNRGPQARSGVQKSPLGLWARCTNWWYWEIGAAILSLAFMLAVVGILFSIHGKPLASWTLSIQPNSLIPVFVTLAKASLLFAVEACVSQLKWLHFEQATHPLDELQTFDSASRGPLGSLVLLWKMRGRAIIASTGALSTIIALAVDPFAQQIISYFYPYFGRKSSIIASSDTNIRHCGYN